MVASASSRRCAWPSGRARAKNWSSRPGSERLLAAVGVQVECAALVAGGGGRLAVVERDGDAVLLEHARREQAAGARADDGDDGWIIDRCRAAPARRVLRQRRSQDVSGNRERSDAGVNSKS